VRTFCRQEGELILRDFVRTSFMDDPLSKVKMYKKKMSSFGSNWSLSILFDL